MKSLYLKLLSWTLFSLLLVACGNADQGIEKKRQDLNGLGTATSVTYGPDGIAKTFGPCKNMTVYGGKDPSFATVYNGASACASTSHEHIVKLKVSANFPASIRFCLIPLTATAALMESCFSVNGQADIALSSSTFSAVVLVREVDVDDYRAFLMNPGGPYPPMAHAVLR